MPSKLPIKLIRLLPEEIERGTELMNRLRENGILCRSWSDLIRLGIAALEKKYPREEKGRKK